MKPSATCSGKIQAYLLRLAMPSLLERSRMAWQAWPLPSCSQTCFQMSPRTSLLEKSHSTHHAAAGPDRERPRSFACELDRQVFCSLDPGEEALLPPTWVWSWVGPKWLSLLRTNSEHHRKMWLPPALMNSHAQGWAVERWELSSVSPTDCSMSDPGFEPRIAVLKVWLMDPWGPLGPFQGVCKVKTILLQG